jgi:glycosyltransferase involved in cell wall biosynthesis
LAEIATHEPVIRVAALNSGRNYPSSRFRLRQYFDALRTFGIQVTEYLPRAGKYAGPSWRNGALARVPSVIASRRYDAVWLNRELVAGRETIERFAGPRVMFDVDDAIWLNGDPGFAASIARRSAVVIAGNQTIANYFAPYAKRLEVIPTTVDTDRWTPALPRAPAEVDEFIVGWSGTGWNLDFLYEIEEELLAFLAMAQTAKVLVVCDREPQFRDLPPGKVLFRKWSPEDEIDAVRAMDVAVMPLPDNEWTRCKCGLKMLCAMSVGVPVVASPVGAVGEILHGSNAGFVAKPGEWAGLLARLRTDPFLRGRMGRAGRERVVESYSVAKHTATLARVFREVSKLPQSRNA